MKIPGGLDVGAAIHAAFDQADETLGDKAAGLGEAVRAAAPVVSRLADGVDRAQGATGGFLGGAFGDGIDVGDFGSGIGGLFGVGNDGLEAPAQGSAFGIKDAFSGGSLGNLDLKEGPLKDAIDKAVTSALADGKIDANELLPVVSQLLEDPRFSDQDVLRGFVTTLDKLPDAQKSSEARGVINAFADSWDRIARENVEQTGSRDLTPEQRASLLAALRPYID